ncbi:MAG: hypothetical protein WCO52_02400 [bacterium]
MRTYFGFSWIGLIFVFAVLGGLAAVAYHNKGLLGNDGTVVIVSPASTPTPTPMATVIPAPPTFAGGIADATPGPIVAGALPKSGPEDGLGAVLLLSGAGIAPSYYYYLRRRLRKASNQIDIY